MDLITRTKLRYDVRVENCIPQETQPIPLFVNNAFTFYFMVSCHDVNSTTLIWQLLTVSTHRKLTAECLLLSIENE